MVDELSHFLYICWIWHKTANWLTSKEQLCFPHWKKQICFQYKKICQLWVIYKAPMNLRSTEIPFHSMHNNQLIVCAILTITMPCDISLIGLEATSWLLTSKKASLRLGFCHLANFATVRRLQRRHLMHSVTLQEAFPNRRSDKNSTVMKSRWTFWFYVCSISRWRKADYAFPFSALLPICLRVHTPEKIRRSICVPCLANQVKTVMTESCEREKTSLCREARLVHVDAWQSIIPTECWNESAFAVPDGKHWKTKS